MAASREGIDGLLRHSGIWRPGQGHEARAGVEAEIEPTGFEALDAALPGGGWPACGLVELAPARPGIGEMRLLLPLVRRVIERGRRALLVHPPHVPYAPALRLHEVDLSRVLWLAGESDAEGFAIAERAARSGACGVVVAWQRERAARASMALRRLQLAARAGACLVVAVRPPEALREPSPAVLRARLDGAGDGLALDVRKCRGRAPGVVRL